ncbi:hypothetical protein A2U01_0108630, partial [Trifolium medium]|nr:hypothetical protein [Trifolium medium]
TVGSPMGTNSRRVVKAVEEEKEAEVIATSVEKWVTRLLSAHRKKTSVSYAGG